MLKRERTDVTEPWAKVADFGASSSLLLPELRVERLSEHVVGNPTWLAPEV